MPDERDIEKTLQAYAKHRREEGGPPPELPPATRSRLQGEVARQFGASKTERGFWVWALWGTPSRMAATGSLAVIIGVGALLLPELWNSSTKSTSEMVLAKNESFQERKLVPVNQAAQDQSATGNLAQETQPKSPGAPAASATSAPVNPTLSLYQSPVGGPAGEALSPKDQPPAATAVAPAVPAPANLLSDRIAGPPTATAPAVTQQFIRVSDASVNLADAAEGAGLGILNSFRFERRGNELRVVDSDGSVYTGQLTLPNTAAEVASAANAVINAPVAPTNPDTSGGVVQANSPPGAGGGGRRAAIPAPQNYSFTVSGTNASLNQLVVFSGELLANNARRGGGGGAAGGAGRGGRGGNGVGGGAPANATNAPIAAPRRGGTPPQAVNFRLQATKVIIGTNEVPINVAPTNAPPQAR